MQLSAIEPHQHFAKMEVHHFTCNRCGATNQLLIAQASEFSI
jgi:hypothetical protein